MSYQTIEPVQLVDVLKASKETGDSYLILDARDALGEVQQVGANLVNLLRRGDGFELDECDVFDSGHMCLVPAPEMSAALDD